MSFADSPGLSTSKAELPVLIFDLDGTILTVNSYPIWAKYMLRGKFAVAPEKRLMLLLRTAAALAARKLFNIDHGLTKNKLQFLWEHVGDNEEATKALSEILIAYVRPNLKSVLALVAQNKVDAVLATSAAQCYADYLGKQLGFANVLATKMGGAENRAEEKHDHTLMWLKERGWADRKRVFFTDHEEDAPLIKECQQTLWFGDRAVPLAEQGNIIPCKNLSDAEVLALLG